MNRTPRRPMIWSNLRRIFDIGLMFEHAAARYPDATVTLDKPLGVFTSEQTVYTYAQLARLVDELAARITAAGVRAGDHVAIHKRANFDIALTACAVARIGAVPVMLSPALDPKVLGVLLQRLHSPWIVTDAAKYAELAAAGSLVGTPVLLTEGAVPSDAGGSRIVALKDVIGAPVRGAVRRGLNEPALITHSSGTTGVPKLMVHTTRTLWHRLLPQQLIGWWVRNREPVLLATSFVHSRFYNSLGVFLNYGNPLAVVSDTDVSNARSMLTANRPTVVETHPNNFVLWEEFADEPDGPLSTVKYYTSTFDAIHPGTVRKLLNASRHRRPALLQLYGQSETGPISGWLHTRNNLDKVDGRCVGVPLTGFIRLRAVDEQGRPVPRGQIGHLVIRSRSQIRTYLSEDERFRGQFLPGGWWRLGDVGWFDRSGRLYLADREVDKIEEIDSNLGIEDMLLERLPDVSEVVIVPDGAGSPTPIVATRGDHPLDRARWAAATAGLPPLNQPIQWRFADFPRTSTWKIRRLEIRDLLGTASAPAEIPAQSP
ncbi:acyl-CoA synthetase [Actinocrinis puniceicyclus]|uniref:Acyl-CoA synthetase n=1 Tax=Actinocrinis puniceicyclus TaxID=977794 RepID=A0A8J7WHK0_9ACTN|nr:AMP-binding protein [Actinocrinis puniceicyclus]MBS2962371.1 acyl-CoA synthetase [Actinocrinis puniceicyclus]